MVLSAPRLTALLFKRLRKEDIIQSNIEIGAFGRETDVQHRFSGSDDHSGFCLSPKL